MASMPSATEAQTKARTNRPDYVRKALDKVGELIRQAAESGDLLVKIDPKTLLPDLYLDQDKYSQVIAHLKLELDLQGYYLREYLHPVLSDDGTFTYETKEGLYVHWGWVAENLDD